MSAGVVGILFEPQDPINVGSVVRACTNTGVDELRLLGVRDFEFHRLAISAPHCEEWIAARLRVVEDWPAAVTGLSRVYAVSGRRHAASTPVLGLDEVAAPIAREPGQRVGFVFGREDRGLPNAVTDRCDAIVTLRSAANSSYNLSHAFAIVAHALLVSGARVDGPAPAALARAAPESLERFMVDVECALDAIEFFKGNQRDNVLRTIRRVVMRAEPDVRELATLWGVFVEVQERARRRRGDG